jgi:hypothetical protein
MKNFAPLRALQFEENLISSRHAESITRRHRQTLRPTAPHQIHRRL